MNAKALQKAHNVKAHILVKDMRLNIGNMGYYGIGADVQLYRIATSAIRAMFVRTVIGFF